MLYWPATFQDLLLSIQVWFWIAKSTNFILASLWLYRKIGVSTSSENLIHFAIRCHRENILVLQLSLADSEKNIIVYYALRGRNWTFHVECDVSSINRRSVPYHTRLKSNFDRLLYIIFFITQIHTVCFVSMNGKAKRVKPSKKKLSKKGLPKKFWKNKVQNKNIHNQNLQQHW